MSERPRIHVDRGEPLVPGRPGRPCPRCGRPAHGGACRDAGSRPGSSPRPARPADGIVRVSRETKGRRGKGVTLVTGLGLAPDELAALGKLLKQRCGAGGTTRDGVIEIQGDHRDLLLAELAARGWEVRRAGG